MEAAIRARRNARAVAGLCAWQAVIALLAACPFVTLAQAVYGRAPAGDAPLWREGGLALLDALWHEAHGATAAARTAAAILIAGSVAGLVPLGCLLATMIHRAGGSGPLGLPRALLRAGQAFPAFAILLVLLGLGQGLAAAGAWAAQSLGEAWTRGALGEARAQQFGVGLALPFALSVAVLGVLHDLSRAAALRFRLPALPALVTAGRALRRHPAAVVWAWAWRSGASLLPVAGGAAVAARLGGRGGTALVVLALAHQAAAASRVALRASWLARALRAVGTADPRKVYFDPSDR